MLTRPRNREFRALTKLRSAKRTARLLRAPVAHAAARRSLHPRWAVALQLDCKAGRELLRDRPRKPLLRPALNRFLRSLDCLFFRWTDRRKRFGHIDPLPRRPASPHE